MRIIACGVFKPAIEHIRPERKFAGLEVAYLPSNLHVFPDRLRSELLGEIESARAAGARPLCLYGECFPGTDACCRERRALRVPGMHCYEMLLGSGLYNELMEETAGTYFLEKDLIENFRSYCVEPLELHDEGLRKMCFAHYKRLLYVRQPSDPDLVPRTKELARFLELTLEIKDADYAHLTGSLSRVLDRAATFDETDGNP